MSGRSVFQLGYQVSPILFTGGIANAIPGNTLPVMALTQSASFVNGLLQGAANLHLDNFFAQFVPMPGGTLVNNQIGKYPFANQAVAANAVIAQPLNISLKMICPSRQPGDMIVRLATITALQAAIAKHTAQGGTYTVATPSYIYTNCILTNLRDISPMIDAHGNKQAQIEWQWDFEQPLVTQQQAQTAYSSLMKLIADGLPIGANATWSGAFSAVGSALSGAVSSVIPSASNLIGGLTGNGPAGSGIASITGGSDSSASDLVNNLGL